jgi:hypothetical protein
MQAITLKGFPARVDQREAVWRVRQYYETESNEELAAAAAGDYLDTLLPTDQCVETTKPGRFWTEFVAWPRTSAPAPTVVFKPDWLRVQRGDCKADRADAPCTVCGCTFAEHAPVQGYPCLHRACDGRLLKL